MPVQDISTILQQFQRGNLASATRQLDALCRAFPACVTLQVLRARAYEQAEQWEEAVKAWQQAQFLLPNSPAIRTGIRKATKVWLASQANPETAGPAVEYMPPEAPDLKDVTGPDETPDERRPESEQPSDMLSELDRLIGELSSARIVPAPDLEAIAPIEMDDEIDDVVSETLALIYATQRQFGEAARVYTRLAQQQPDRSDEFLRKAEDLRQRSTGGA